MAGLLTLAGTALIGEHRAIGEDPALSCTAFQVGSHFAGNTHIHLENAGPDRTEVRVYFVDHDGRYSHSVGYAPVLNPWAAGELMFRTPALGAAVKIISSGTSLHAGVEILRDDGAPTEIRDASGCLAGSVLRQVTPVIPPGAGDT
jgi:hypothetical protein